jgi:hypothetical protein
LRQGVNLTSAVEGEFWVVSENKAFVFNTSVLLLENSDEINEYCS